MKDLFACKEVTVFFHAIEIACITTIIINNYEIVQKKLPETQLHDIEEILFHAVDESKICSEPDETVYQALGYILQTREKWCIEPNDLFLIINKLFKSNKHTTATFLMGILLTRFPEMPTELDPSIMSDQLIIYCAQDQNKNIDHNYTLKLMFLFFEYSFHSTTGDERIDHIRTLSDQISFDNSIYNCKDVFYETTIRVLMGGSECSEGAIRSLLPYIMVWITKLNMLSGNRCNEDRGEVSFVV